MHIKEQAEAITINVSTAKQNLSLLIKHKEKLGINKTGIELIEEAVEALNEATKAIRGDL